MNRYRLLVGLLSLPIIMHAAWLAIRNNEFKYLLQRLGLKYSATKNQNLKTKHSNTIWIHAASVGEVNAAVHLINTLYKNNTIILTTNTQSSAAHANKILSEKVIHYYCPIDWRWAIKKFITQLQPKYLFIIETELWPNLYSVCDSMNIPISIINGRISKRTLNAASWIKKRYRECLQSTKVVLTRSKEDSQRFITLGASTSIVREIGNIKFYQQESLGDNVAFKTIKPYVLVASTRDEEEVLIVKAWLATSKESRASSNLLVIVPRHPHRLNTIISQLKPFKPYVLVASTRDEEEVLIVKAWLATSKESRASSNLLVIVPRHPHRLNTIISQLKPFNLNIAVRSKKDEVKDETDIYIADTFGELVSFIKGSQFVVMGGSFVSKGGQNILEVAHAGKTVVFGPYMDNFKDEAKLFIDSKAGIQLANTNGLPEVFHELLTQANKLQTLQDNAKQLMQKQQTVLDDYTLELQKLFPQIIFN